MTITPSTDTTLAPRLFRAEAIDPETAAFNARLAELLASVPPLWSQPPSVIRGQRVGPQPVRRARAE